MDSKDTSLLLLTANRLLRETLAKILSNKGGFKVSSASPSGTDLCDVLATPQTEILILDSIAPNHLNGEFITESLRRSPAIKIVFIDMDDDPEIFLKCILVGAKGYLLKDASAASVLCTIRAVAQGQVVYPAQICLSLFRDVSRHSTVLPSGRIKTDLGLTRRQQQLVPLIAEGLTNKEIASRLNLSEQTIKNHIHNILRRVGVDNRLQVADATQQYEARP